MEGMDGFFDFLFGPKKTDKMKPKTTGVKSIVPPTAPVETKAMPASKVDNVEEIFSNKTLMIAGVVIGGSLLFWYLNKKKRK